MDPYALTWGYVGPSQSHLEPSWRHLGTTILLWDGEEEEGEDEEANDDEKLKEY